MLYQRSFEIEQRLDRVLHLIGTGRYSTPRLAEQLRVSIPTVSRDVTALRERGHNIRAERRPDGWTYILLENSSKHIGSQDVSRDEVHSGAEAR